LVNSFSHTDREWTTVDPTLSIVPTPSDIHPIDRARDGEATDASQAPALP